MPYRRLPKTDQARLTNGLGLSWVIDDKAYVFSF